jgi:hypothetical protein
MAAGARRSVRSPLAAQGENGGMPIATSDPKIQSSGKNRLVTGRQSTRRGGR